MSSEEIHYFTCMIKENRTDIGGFGPEATAFYKQHKRELWLLMNRSGLYGIKVKKKFFRTTMTVSSYQSFV